MRCVIALMLLRGISIRSGRIGGRPGGRRWAGRPPAGPPGGFSLFQYLPLPLDPVPAQWDRLLVLGAALYLPALALPPLVRWLLIAFAAVTFVLRFLFNGFRLNPSPLWARS
jgi:hypothetical protein